MTHLAEFWITFQPFTGGNHYIALRFDAFFRPGILIGHCNARASLVQQSSVLWTNRQW